MDVDSDLDHQFMQQFSCMGTTDKDVLISEFQKLLGNQLNPAGCAFFLDMNNWNLQAAVCSYYDFEQPKESKLPNMALVEDITIGEGESVLPNTKFVKTWRVQNTGEEAWPVGCYLKFAHGDQLGPVERAAVEACLPGHVMDISIEMWSPAVKGTYQGQWRMCLPSGIYFGETIWVILPVDEGGLLSVTQQLSNFEGVGHSSPQKADGTSNPFGTPTRDAPETNGLPNASQNVFGVSPLSNHGSSGGLDSSQCSTSPNSSMFVQVGTPPHNTQLVGQTPYSSPVKAALLFQDSNNRDTLRTLWRVPEQLENLPRPPEDSDEMS